LLIKERRLIQEHIERLDMEIAQIVEHSREGQILLSIPPICPMYAAAILATIGHIGNFEDAGHLKAYFGWAPKRAQTGVSGVNPSAHLFSPLASSDMRIPHF
jgi:transposase